MLEVFVFPDSARCKVSLGFDSRVEPADHRILLQTEYEEIRTVTVLHLSLAKQVEPTEGF